MRETQQQETTGADPENGKQLRKKEEKGGQQRPFSLFVRPLFVFVPSLKIVHF